MTNGSLTMIPTPTTENVLKVILKLGIQNSEGLFSQGLMLAKTTMTEEEARAHWDALS